MPTEIAIRVAERGDHKKLEDLQRRASLIWAEYREALIAHPGAIELPLEQIVAGRAYVAERDGQILGFSVVLPRSNGDADLDGMFVDPTAWRQGIGRSLIRKAELLAASQGAEWLYVIANPRALGFYESCAFELIGEVQTRFGAGPTMRKRLHAGLSGR